MMKQYIMHKCIKRKSIKKVRPLWRGQSSILFELDEQYNCKQTNSFINSLSG